MCSCVWPAGWAFLCCHPSIRLLHADACWPCRGLDVKSPARLAAHTAAPDCGARRKVPIDAARMPVNWDRAGGVWRDRAAGGAGQGCHSQRACAVDELRPGVRCVLCHAQ
eukprot:366139-Chlamydomonas_euryale.AAC.3